jgi:uncharacterized protein YyaL (SSP411 family)
MRFLAAPAVTDGLGYDTGGLLLAERELVADPVHVTIVGGKDVAEAQELFATALRGLPISARIEWLDHREGALPRSDVEFPSLARPAAFLCANGSCSMPLTRPEQLRARLSAVRKNAP